MGDRSFSIGAADAFEMVEFRQLGGTVPEDISLDPPRKPGLKLVGHVTAGGHGEYVVEFFQGAHLCRTRGQQN